MATAAVVGGVLACADTAPQRTAVPLEREPEVGARLSHAPLSPQRQQALCALAAAQLAVHRRRQGVEIAS